MNYNNNYSNYPHQQFVYSNNMYPNSDEINYGFSNPQQHNNFNVVANNNNFQNLTIANNSAYGQQFNCFNIYSNYNNNQNIIINNSNNQGQFNHFNVNTYGNNNQSITINNAQNPLNYGQQAKAGSEENSNTKAARNPNIASKVKKPLKLNAHAAVFVPFKQQENSKETVQAVVTNTSQVSAPENDVSALFDRMTINDQSADAHSHAPPLKTSTESANSIDQKNTRGIDYGRILSLMPSDDSENTVSVPKKAKKVGKEKIDLNINEDIAVDFKKRFKITQKINGEHKSYKFAKTKPLAYKPNVEEWFANNGTQEEMQVLKKKERYKGCTDKQIVYDRICHIFPERIDALLEDSEFCYQVDVIGESGCKQVKKYLFVELEYKETFSEGVLGYYFENKASLPGMECFHRRFTVIKDKTDILRMKVKENIEHQEGYIKIFDKREGITIRIFKDIFNEADDE